MLKFQSHKKAQVSSFDEKGLQHMPADCENHRRCGCPNNDSSVCVSFSLFTPPLTLPSTDLIFMSLHCYLWPVIAVDLKWYTTPSIEKSQPQKGYIFNPMSFPIQSIACPQKDLEWKTCRECRAGSESARYKQCKLTFLLKNCFCFLAAYYQHIEVRQKEGVMVSLGNTRSQNHSREAGNRVFPVKCHFYHNWLLPHSIILLAELSTHHKSYDAVFAFLMEV